MAIVPVVNKNYDIVLNGVGYRLVPNSLHVSRATPFTTRIATGKPTHSDLDQWDVVSYTGWTHGLGQEGGGETVADPLAFYDADGIETTIPGQFCLATRIVESDPNFIARKFCDSAKYVFAGGDTAIRHYDHLADVWANSVTGLGSMVTDLCRFQGSIYAALGDAGADMQRCADPDAAPTTWAALTGVKRQHLCTWKDKLWGTNGINLYSYDGTTWSDAIPIGGEGFAITALIPMGNLLVVGKTDRLFYYDGINVVETPLIVTDYRGNFSQGVVWQGYLYVPVLGTIQKIGGIGAAINVIDATPRWWGNDARINHGFGFPIACTFHPKAVFVLFHLAEGDRPA